MRKRCCEVGKFTQRHHRDTEKISGGAMHIHHIAIAVNDLEGSVQYAIQCGATVADKQFSKNWTVMFDPFGHPFCLCQMKSIMESADFKLL